MNTMFTKAWILGMGERVITTFVFAFGGALVTDGVIAGTSTLATVHWINDLSIAAVAAILSLIKATSIPTFTAGTPKTNAIVTPTMPMGVTPVTLPDPVNSFTATQSPVIPGPNG